MEFHFTKLYFDSCIISAPAMVHLPSGSAMVEAPISPAEMSAVEREYCEWKAWRSRPGSGAPLDWDCGEGDGKSGGGGCVVRGGWKGEGVRKKLGGGK